MPRSETETSASQESYIVACFAETGDLYVTPVVAITESDVAIAALGSCPSGNKDMSLQFWAPNLLTAIENRRDRV